MSPTLYSFPTLLNAYRDVLIGNPGTALDTGSGIAALVDSSGEVYGAIIDKGRIDFACTFDFESRSFRDGHWEDLTVEDTVATVESPRLIDLVVL